MNLVANTAPSKSSQIKLEETYEITNCYVT